MCLSLPAKILEIKNNKAIIEMDGKKQEIDTRLVSGIKQGSFCLISNGFIVKKISAQEAEGIFNILHKNL